MKSLQSPTYTSPQQEGETKSGSGSGFPLWLHVSIVLSIMSLFAGFVTAELFRQQETPYLIQNLKHHGQQITSLIAASAVEAMIVEDIPELNIIAEQMFENNRELIRLMFRNARGDILMSWEKGHEPKEFFTFTEHIEVKGQVFGDLIVEWSTDGQMALINQHISTFRQRVILTILALGGLFLWLIYLMVIRPLSRVNRKLIGLSHAESTRVDELPAYYANELQNLNRSVRDLGELWHQQKRREAELEHAQREALEASRIKSQFIANMSHELRTPLNAVVGMLELAHLGEIPDRPRRYVNKAMTAAHWLMKIINDILDYAKLQDSCLQIEVDDFDLGAVIPKVYERALELAQQKQLELSCEVEGPVPRRLRGDPLRLEQVLKELCSNAIKFTDSGGSVKVVISSTLGPEGARHLNFRVTDTGIGMSPEQQAHIFDSFSQADNSNTRRFGGTGLGLYISRQLVLMMGGDIKIESALGQGSCFEFGVAVGVRDEDDLLTEQEWLGDHVSESDAEESAESDASRSQTSVAVLDTEGALARMGGDSDLYQAVLEKFAENHVSCVAELKNLLTLEQFEDARLLVHSLKGVAGSIGAIELQQLALTFESKLSQRQRLSEHEMQTLGNALQAVFEQIHQMQSADDRLQAEPSKTGADDLGQSLEDLRQHIQDFDAEAQDLAASLAEQISDPALKAQIIAIEKALEGYDFDLALSKLEALLNSASQD